MADPTAVDWINSASDLIGSLATAALAAVAICGAFRGFSRYEKSQIDIEKRRLKLESEQSARRFAFETAEEALDAFSRFQKTLNRVLSPAGPSEEDRQGAERFLSKQARQREGRVVDDVWAPVILFRLKKYQKSADDLDNLRPKFRACFGSDELIDKALCIWEEIYSSAQRLTRGVPEGQFDRHDEVISDAEDVLKDRCKAILNELHTILEPHFRVSSADA